MLIVDMICLEGLKMKKHHSNHSINIVFLQEMIIWLKFNYIKAIIISWQQFGNNHSVGRNNHCNLYKNMSHIGIKPKQNKLI